MSRWLGRRSWGCSTNAVVMRASGAGAIVEKRKDRGDEDAGAAAAPDKETKGAHCTHASPPSPPTEPLQLGQPTRMSRFAYPEMNPVLTARLIARRLICVGVGAYADWFHSSLD